MAVGSTTPSGNLSNLWGACYVNAMPNKTATIRRPWDAIVWCELRRIPFNVLILAVGGLSLAVILLFGSYFVTPGEVVIEPLGIVVGVIVYGVLANLAYTLGWTTELLWTWGDTQRTELMRPRVFWVGIVFSVSVTVLPAILIPLAWIIFGFQHG
jgi:hypothetical protein